MHATSGPVSIESAFRVLAAVIVIVLFASCDRVMVSPPSVGQVRSLSVITGLNEREITDSNSIRRVSEFLATHNSGWSTPFGTFPSPQYTVVLHRTDGTSFVLFVGVKWIGVRNELPGHDSNVARSISSEEENELRELLKPNQISAPTSDSVVHQ